MDYCCTCKCSALLKDTESCPNYVNKGKIGAKEIFFSVISASLFLVIFVVLLFFGSNFAPGRKNYLWVLGIGIVISMFLVALTKSFVQEPRPFQDTCKNAKCPKKQKLCNSSSGMPSGHASAIVLIAIISILLVYKHFGQTKPYLALGCSLLIAVYCSGVLYSRYYLKYHSAAQLAVGSAIGLVLGIIGTIYINKAQGSQLDWRVQYGVMLAALIAMTAAVVKNSGVKAVGGIIGVYVVSLLLSFIVGVFLRHIPIVGNKGYVRIAPSST